MNFNVDSYQTPLYTSSNDASLLQRSVNSIQNTLSEHAIGMFAPKRLPSAVVPLVEYIDTKRPNIVIACDRGARLAGVALFAAWKQLHNERFPTLDNKLHFARVSTAKDPSIVQGRIDTIIDRSLFNQEKHVSDALDVLFIDDWTVDGKVKQLALSMLKNHNARGTFATLCGKKADFNARPYIPVFLGSITTWRDNPNHIGVEYSSAKTPPEYKPTSPARVKSKHALVNRRQIHESARKLQPK